MANDKPDCQVLVGALGFDEHLNDTLVALQNNTVSGTELIQYNAVKLPYILHAIANTCESTDTGTDLMLRGPYVTFQGMMETALTALKIDKDIDVLAVIITPEPPKPLQNIEEKTLSQVNLDKPIDFAHYRHSILSNFMEARGTLCCIHNEVGPFPNYNEALVKYTSNIVDKPIAAPILPNITGAMYIFNLKDIFNETMIITTESYQVGQKVDKIATWSIKLGDKAVKRFAQVQEVLGINIQQFCRS